MAEYKLCECCLSLPPSQIILLYCIHPFSHDDVRWENAYTLRWSEVNDIDVVM